MPPGEVRRNRWSLRSVGGRRAAELRRGIGEEVRQLRLDAGVSQRELADASGLEQGFVSMIERGQRESSMSALSALANSLGADLVVHLYPNTGPRVRDRVQATIVEGLLRIVHPSWTRLLEVPVYRPSRGVIDIVLARGSEVVAVEVHSELRRVEQQLRWARQKADALPSAAAWDRLTAGVDRPRVSPVLVLRATRRNRQIDREFAQTFETAYPADPDAALTALTTARAEWPGPARLWASSNGSQTTIGPRQRGQLARSPNTAPRRS